MSQTVIFNLGLLPQFEFSKRLTEYSQKIKGIQNGLYFLGDLSLPHVTLLQFEDFEQNAKALWDLVMHLDSNDLEIDFRGLSIEKWNQLDCIWMRVSRKQNLEKLQEAAIFSLRERNLILMNGIGQDYDPHSTLAAWHSQDYLPELPLDSRLFGAKGVKVRLALGVSGPTYQFAKKIFPIE